MKKCLTRGCKKLCCAKGLCSKHYDAKRLKEHPEKCRASYRRWAAKNIEREHERKKKWNRDNAQRCRENNRRWEKANKLRRRQYKSEKYKRDKNFKLAACLRSRLYKTLRKYLHGCEISAIRDLGCTTEEAVAWIESQFVSGMSWNNWGCKTGDWSLDHIFPLSRTNSSDRIELLKVCHYTNLRPMWHIDNMKKGAKIA